MRKTIALWFLFLLALSALTQFWSPVHEALIYERASVFDGQIWRLFTVPSVHYSLTHWVLNIVPLLMLGWLALRLNIGGTVLLFFLCGTLGAAYLLTQTAIVYFAGLSGYVVGMWALVCLHCLVNHRALKTVGAFGLAVVCGKIVFEGLGGELPWSSTHAESFRSLPMIHLLGLVSALMVFFGLLQRRTVSNRGQENAPCAE